MAAPSTSKRRPRERIEISIPLLKRYVRNSAPPQPPISLLPARDSDAFIIDKVVHPVTAVIDKDVQRRACYIIGWPDLPAARVMISCTRALDYVSPWEMENWEYKDALRREEEEFEKDTAAAMLASAAEMPGAAAEPVKKRRGRPPRAALQDQPPPTPILGAEDRKLIAQKKAAGPSLSTPPKRRWEELLPDEEEEEEVPEEGYDDSDEAIPQQLGVEDREGTTESTAEGAERRGPKLDKSARIAPATPSRWAGEDTDSDDSDQASLASFNGPPRRGMTAGMGHSKLLSDHSPMPPAKRVKLRSAPSPLRLSPGQEVSLEARTSPSESGGPTSSAASLSEQTRPARHINKLRNTPKLQSLMLSQKKRSLGNSRNTPVRNLTATAPVNGRPGAAPSSATPTPRAIEHRIAPPIQSTTLAHPKSAKQVSPSHNGLTTQSPPLPTASRRKKTDKPQKAVGIDVEESAWDIKGLEGDKIVEDEDGAHVRYFKVRWKGDWPPDQNPTWEPEHNISKGAVRAYLKKKAQRSGEASSATPKKSLKQNTLPPWIGHKKFSSVSEAFADGEDVEMAEPALMEHDDAVAVESGDELQVTDERDHGSTLRRLKGSSLDVTLAEQLRFFNRRA